MYVLPLGASLDVFPLRLTIHDPGESLDPPLRIEHVLFFALEFARLMTAAGRKEREAGKRRNSGYFYSRLSERSPTSNGGLNAWDRYPVIHSGYHARVTPIGSLTEVDHGKIYDVVESTR